MQCTEREWFERTCVFENLVMYNGQLYFIAEEGQRPELPTARLNEYDKGPEEEGAVGVKSLLKVSAPRCCRLRPLLAQRTGWA